MAGMLGGARHPHNPHNYLSLHGFVSARASRKGSAYHEIHDQVAGLPVARTVRTNDTHDSRRLAAIVESSRDAIIGKDLHGIVTSWNRAAEEMFGYSSAEMIGTSIRRIVPADRQDQEDRILQAISRGERVDQLETVRLAKDGRLIEVSITAAPIKDAHGKIVGISKIARDISPLLQREREAAQLSRLYKALSQINQAIVWNRSRDELLPKICRILVEDAGFTLAWIGWHEPETQRIMPLAVSGGDEDYVRSIRVYADERPEGRGPTGTAFRSGTPRISNDLQADPATLPWRDRMLRHNLRAAAAIPIREQGSVRGALTVYSNRAGFFREQEIALLEEAAGDIGFGLDNLVRDLAVQRARRFTDAMMEGIPGILHVHDDNGRLLRWNRQFEQVSGYAANEIARMRLTDFFDEADKAQLTAKGAEVATGASATLEAAFVTKDGRALPYNFIAQNAELDGTPGVVCIGIDMTARIEAEKVRKLSEERYRRLFECAPDGILLADPDGTYLDANPAICRMLGFTREELLGRNANDIVVPAEQHHIAPALRDINAGTDYHREWIFRRKDGSTFAADVIGALMPDGNIMGMIRDISESKRADEQLRRSEDRFRVIFEQAGVGMGIVDVADGRILRGNRAILAMFGYDANELLAMTAAQISVPESAHSIEQRARLFRGEIDRFQMEKSYRRKDGGELWGMLTSTLVRDADGKPQFVINMVEDITDRKHAELALRELNETLEQRVAARTDELRSALVQAESAERAKSTFLATMSHELRTPLNSILGFTGLVLMGLAGPLTAEQTRQLGMVKASAARLLELINDVLDLSKIEAGQFATRVEPFDLRALVERAAESVRPSAEMKGITLTATVAEGIGELRSDRRRVEQILINLLGNAIKFTESGGVTVTAEPWAPSADGQPQPDRSGARIAVADTGIGIKPEALGLLFKPFQQIDDTISRRNEGTGLGLAISQRLAHLLGGEIGVSSEWGRGSRFTVYLPAKSASGPA